MNLFSSPIDFLLMSTGRIPAILFALAFHEAAHAWMANKLGDDTAARMGRISLNPMVHLDPIGSIGLLLGFLGWGRPVPYVERNLKNPLRDGMLIAAAGPCSNLILAAISGVIYRLLLVFGDSVSAGAGERVLLFLIFLMSWSVIINLCLCFFNLIPLFPLDGEKILMGILPYQKAHQFAQLRQFGPMLLLMLIIMGQGLISSWVFMLATPFSWLFTGTSLNGIFMVMSRVFDYLW